MSCEIIQQCLYPKEFTRFFALLRVDEMSCNIRVQSKDKYNFSIWQPPYMTHLTRTNSQELVSCFMSSSEGVMKMISP